MADSATNGSNRYLTALIHARIAEAGGWLAFEDFMQLALHTPGHGYYATGTGRVGSTGDFITAAETGSLFAGCLANWVMANLPEGGSVCELGPGTGRLAAGILQALATQATVPPYLLLETSTGLREQQVQLLHDAKLSDHCTWLEQLPQDFTGVIIANEVLDALACRVLVNRDGKWLQRGVRMADTGYVWADGPAAAPHDVARLENFDLPDSYCLEINRQAEALVATLTESLNCGAMLFIDYGFARRELYHPQRGAGTLMTHQGHRADTNALADPGLRDLTAHIDFTAMASAAVAAGATICGFTTQAAFLLDLGIEKLAQANVLDDPIACIKRSQELQTLLMPHEMGELIKVLSLSCGTTCNKIGFGLRGRDL